MCNLREKWDDMKLVEKFRAYENRGIVIGLVIALLVIALATIAIVKYLWLKKQFDGLCYDLDDLYDDEDFCEEECCCEQEEEGCGVANEKDLEKI
ncbi:MAG: hypothetical protein FWB88_07810 [Defluviitaleaceae bacterium]|nr:hypothetical protein [Defluviitaleaceae bacterium]MCL2240101.1 hypothetical protein [Defluviitaleaceae bacterium]